MIPKSRIRIVGRRDDGLPVRGEDVKVTCVVDGGTEVALTGVRKLTIFAQHGARCWAVLEVDAEFDVDIVDPADVELLRKRETG